MSERTTVIEGAEGDMRGAATDEWTPADVDVVIEPITEGTDKVIARLVLTASAAGWQEHAEISVELTANDIVYLLRAVGQVHNDEMLKDRA